MRLLSLCSLICLLLGLLLGDAAFADTTYTVKTDASTVTYHIHVPGSLEKADGPSKKVEGSAKIAANGAVEATFRAPVESFYSGNAKRDTKMHAATDSAHFPFVEAALHGGVAVPSTFPTTVTRTMKLEIKLHGITQTVDVPATIRFEAANKIVVTTTFTLSLESFKVERPKLMFWRVADDLRIQADITFVQ